MCLQNLICLQECTEMDIMTIQMFKDIKIGFGIGDHCWTGGQIPYIILQCTKPVVSLMMDINFSFTNSNNYNNSILVTLTTHQG